MKISLSSTVLSSHLSMLSKIISSKNAMQILDCFLFESVNGMLSITASDNENMLRTMIPLENYEGEGRFAVNNRTILDAVKDLPEQPITIEVDINTYSIRVIYQNGLYNFTAQNADEYPVPPVMPDDCTLLTMGSGMLSDALTRTLFATAAEELRPVMNGIYFDLTPEALAIVASDGHKLVRNKIFTIKSEAPTSFILPKKPATLLKNVLNKDDSEVEIRFNGRNAEVQFNDNILMCRLIDGRYPNYNSVIPTDNPEEVTIDRKSLISALRHVLPFASESSQLVRLHIEMGKAEVSSEDIDFSTSAKEEITCDFSGTPMNMGFKGTSLVEILNNLTGEQVMMKLADPSRPCLLLPCEQPANEDVLMLIMPMLLND